MASRFLLAAIVIFVSFPAMAQIEGDFWNGGAVRIGPPTSDCDAGARGALRYNDTTDQMEFCDGNGTWRYMAADTGVADNTPDAFTFTDLTDQPLNTLVTSETVTITGITGTVSVSGSGSGSPEISINGGAWTTSGAILSGQTLQIRMTTSGSVSTPRTTTITLGTYSEDWVVTTRAGALKIFRTSAAYLGTAIGGLAGADALCQAAANSAGYAGTYKAILSDSTTDAKDRLTLSYPIVRATDGVTVESSNLWDGSLDAAIHPVCCNNAVWTGTDGTGTKTANTCSDWSASGGNGTYGSTATSTGPGWTSSSSSACTSAYGLYCIQQ